MSTNEELLKAALAKERRIHVLHESLRRLLTQRYEDQTREVNQLRQNLEALGRNHHRLQELVQSGAYTESGDYRAGRAEGQADVAVMFRRMVDPLDKEHLNVDGVLQKVSDLMKPCPRCGKARV